MISPIYHLADWRYIRQSKQAQIEKGVIRENTNKIDYNYRVGYQVLIRIKSVYK